MIHIFRICLPAREEWAAANGGNERGVVEADDEKEMGRKKG